MNNIQKLSSVIEKYGSDKALSGYTKLYGELFSKYISRNINYLEIGLGTLDPSIPSTFVGNPAHYPHYKPAGILRAWKEYFENAHIHGIDVAEDCMISDDKITTYLLDSTDERSCNDLLPSISFDIILDDGLHTSDAQIKTFRNFFSKLSEGGLYIIEDIGGAGDSKNVWVEHKPEILTYISSHEYFYGGNCLIIRKNSSGKGEIPWHAFTESLSVVSQSSKVLYDKELIADLDPDTQPSKANPPSCSPRPHGSNLTIVSGLWDIGREGRSFDQYKDAFDDFLKIPQKMILFIPKELEDFVWERRGATNTSVVIFELEDIRLLFDPFWDDVQSIRQDPNWYNSTGENGWLANSPQAVNEWYNPIVMSKYSLLHTACCYNNFNTDYLLWVDAGLSSTVNHMLMDEQDVFSKIEKYLNPFLFLSYPYEANTEIHGFEIEAMNNIARDKVSYVCRGGIFGGHKDFIHKGNEAYWHLLKNTLSSGYMGTEEPIFTLMSYTEPHIYRRYSLDGNGLVTKFIQELDSTGEVSLEEVTNNRKAPKPVFHDISHVKTNLYFLTFNYPDQLEYTIAALAEHNGFTDGPHQKVVIDNSTKAQARIDNKKVCDKYGFEHIIQEKNTGICGGRQCAAEHFHDSAADFYLFFEDDMTLSAPGEGSCCRNGFKKYIPDLYLKLHQIMIKEDFDFLKLNFTEVYMDNNIQTSWYNVPQDIRDTEWPEYNALPTHGLDPYSPRTRFKNIERISDGLCYISGEIYYCNWPMIVSKKGNQKMFINTKWAHYFEGTWMSHIFQETKKGNINPAVLLASPVTHERFKHYKPEERIEGSIINPDLKKIKNI